MNTNINPPDITKLKKIGRSLPFSLENQRVLRQVILCLIFLVCSLAIFLFGANYAKLFITNGNFVYATFLSGVFLVTTLFLKNNVNLTKYWPISYAFFVASIVNLVSSVLGGYYGEFLKLFNVSVESNQGIGLSKLYDTLLVVIPILVLTVLSGADLKSLYLARGNQYYRWGFGIGSLIVLNFLTSAVIFFGMGYEVSRLGSVILWGAVFAFSNSLLEELWVRGVFLKKLLPLIGIPGTVLISSIWFGALHFLAIAYMPAMVVPIFTINTFTLGIACSLLMIKTNSIWGAYLIHAAADWFLFIALLAFH